MTVHVNGAETVNGHSDAVTVGAHIGIGGCGDA